jgi:hypothetical protein
LKGVGDDWMPKLRESGTRSSKRRAADLENACSLDLTPDLMIKLID